MTVRISTSLAIVFLFTFSPHLLAQQATVTLAGYNHVPPVPSPGTGILEVTLQGDSLSIGGKFSQLSSSFYGAFIHYGSKNEQGNQLFRLEPELNESKTGGTFDPARNRWKLNESLLQALAEGNLYINIYSANYKRGELRCQIPSMK